MRTLVQQSPTGKELERSRVQTGCIQAVKQAVQPDYYLKAKPKVNAHKVTTAVSMVQKVLSLNFKGRLQRTAGVIIFTVLVHRFFPNNLRVKTCIIA